MNSDPFQMSEIERSGLHFGGRIGKYSQHGDACPSTEKYRLVLGALQTESRWGVLRLRW